LPRTLVAGVVALVVMATLGAVFGGPSLGEHEAFVALCARNMRLSGDWLVPEFMGTAWIRKPPLPYWLVAAASYLFPNDPQTNLPVTTSGARLPTALTALVTILLLWRLGSSMFGRRVGVVAAVVAASSLVFLLYAPNATAEMPLTCCCVWSYVHFWYAATARRTDRRFLHAMLFYVAMGFAMLAKGPAPIALVAAPLAVWWYTERPLRLLARCGPSGWRPVVVLFLRQLWPQTVRAFTRLWLLPGLIVFVLIFVPWMLAVAAKHPHAWDLWNWQYWQRAQGRYTDTRPRGFFYYVPVVLGLALPWVFLILEAIAAPWLRRYARWRRPLLYAGLWALIGILAMSSMAFKKPYYVTPALPGLLLLIAVVADRFFSWVPHSGPIAVNLLIGSHRRILRVSNAMRLVRIVWKLLAVGAVVGLIAGAAWLRKEMPPVWVPLTLLGAAVLSLFLVAGAMWIRGRGRTALGITAVTTVAAFHLAWYLCGPEVDRRGDIPKIAAMARVLEEMKLPPGAKVLWPVSEPDARLGFYFNRRTDYMITPEEIVTRIVDRKHHMGLLHEMVLTRANELLRSSEPVYFILDRDEYERYAPSLSRRGHIVAVAPDPQSSEDDWVIVSNATSTNPTSSNRSPTS